MQQPLCTRLHAPGLYSFRFYASHKLLCTVTCRRKLHDWALSRGKSHPGGRLHWGGLKDFADGSLGSRTALMHQPYTDDPSSRGVRLTPKETLQEMVTAADMTGLQVIPKSPHIMPVWNLGLVFGPLFQQQTRKRDQPVC